MFNGKKRMVGVIPLPPVTKKNHQQIIERRDPRTGRKYPLVIQSAQYREYEKLAGWYIKQGHGLTPITGPVNVKYLFYMPTRRKVDLSNLINAADDILVKYKILEDDNRNVIAGHDGSRVYLDRDNPRTEIEITPIDPAEEYEQWGGAGK